MWELFSVYVLWLLHKNSSGYQEETDGIQHKYENRSDNNNGSDNPRTKPKREKKSRHARSDTKKMKIEDKGGENDKDRTADLKSQTSFHSNRHNLERVKTLISEERDKQSDEEMDNGTSDGEKSVRNEINGDEGVHADKNDYESTSEQNGDRVADDENRSSDNDQITENEDGDGKGVETVGDKENDSNLAKNDENGSINESDGNAKTRTSNETVAKVTENSVSSKRKKDKQIPKKAPGREKTNLSKARSML